MINILFIFLLLSSVSIYLFLYLLKKYIHIPFVRWVGIITQLLTIYLLTTIFYDCTQLYSHLDDGLFYRNGILSTTLSYYFLSILLTLLIQEQTKFKYLKHFIYFCWVFSLTTTITHCLYIDPEFYYNINLPGIGEYLNNYYFDPDRISGLLNEILKSYFFVCRYSSSCDFYPVDAFNTFLNFFLLIYSFWSYKNWDKPITKKIFYITTLLLFVGTITWYIYAIIKYNIV